MPSTLNQRRSTRTYPPVDVTDPEMRRPVIQDPEGLLINSETLKGSKPGLKMPRALEELDSLLAPDEHAFERDLKPSLVRAALTKALVAAAYVLSAVLWLFGALVALITNVASYTAGSFQELHERLRKRASLAPWPDLRSGHGRPEVVQVVEVIKPDLSMSLKAVRLDGSIWLDMKSIVASSLALRDQAPDATSADLAIDLLMIMDDSTKWAELNPEGFTHTFEPRTNSFCGTINHSLIIGRAHWSDKPGTTRLA